jgi:hypothetical protein
MNTPPPREPNPTALATLAVIVPFALMGLYLGFSRWPSRWFTEGSDYVALIACVGFGIAQVWRMPLSQKHRMVAAFGLAVILAVGLPLFGYAFIGLVFGDWR